MFKPRRNWRRPARAAVRRTLRSRTRVRWRVPDELGPALRCFRRALRAHRRLARLAPRFFDSVVIERERRDREARRRWMDLWEPALVKVYGPAARPRPDTDTPPPLPPRTRRLVEHELASWNSWFSAARTLMARYRQHRPHAVPTLNQLVRLVELATDLGRLATGVDATPPVPEPDPYARALADLERAYGHRGETGAVGAGSAPTSPVSQPAPSAGSAPPPPVSKASPDDCRPPPEDPRSPLRPAEPPPVASPQPERCRRDAWSSWARQLRAAPGSKRFN